MKSILVIHPYFGRFPKMFPFWLESCKLNKTVDFLIVTNQEIQSDADNIIIKKSSLTQVKSQLESICGMNIWLEKPYKLCDFRPLFGKLFSEYTQKYDFWGYCDCDLVFGDIRHFLTEEVLNNHDYILGWGHFHVQRTIDSKFDEVWRTARGLWRNIGWKDVFASDQNEWFDELPYGVAGRYYGLYPERCWMGYTDNHAIFESPALSQLPFQSLFNDYTLWKSWSCYQNHLNRLPFLKRNEGGDLHHIIYQKEGIHLFTIGINQENRIEKREILYAHFYKRNLDIRISNKSIFIIRPNAIVDCTYLSKYILMYYAHHPSIYWENILYRINRKLGILKKKHLK